MEDSSITDMKTFECYEDVVEYVSDRFYMEKVYSFNDNVEFYFMKKK